MNKPTRSPRLPSRARLRADQQVTQHTLTKSPVLSDDDGPPSRLRARDYPLSGGPLRWRRSRSRRRRATTRLTRPTKAHAGNHGARIASTDQVETTTA